MSQGAIFYISLFGAKKCDIGPEHTCVWDVTHLMSISGLGPTPGHPRPQPPGHQEVQWQEAKNLEKYITIIQK